MNTRIPILICIDIEPNERKLDPQARVDWTGFEKSYEFFSELRPRLEMATGSPVHFSWFLRMDPQITHTYGSPDWVVSRYARLIEELEAAGDELGLHAHAWRWDEESQDWIADFGDQEWIDHCLRSSFEAFHASLNRQCRSFRFGDHWMNNQTLDLLERLGVQFDLTLEPGQAGTTLLPDEHFTGSFPDGSGIPRLPYRPDETDFTKPRQERERELWIIPASAGSTMWIPFEQSTHGVHVTLNLAFDRPVFSSILDTLLCVFREPYVALQARTDIAINPKQRVNLEQNVDYLLSHPLLKTFAFETPAQAIRRLGLHGDLTGRRLTTTVPDRAENEIVSLLARLLLAHIANNERKEVELKRMTSTLGWRLLRLYGKIKYPYLLPIYQLLHLATRPVVK